MNKIITINLGGIAIQIEEDAYDLLRDYLKSLELHFSGTENADEILSDIEGRIAEMLYERLKLGKVSINNIDIREVTSAMGKPTEMDGDEDETRNQNHTQISNARKTKRLFRDVDDRKVGGVCSGIAKYFDLDVTLVRIIWLVLFFVFGTGFVIYFLLWAILPEAKTAAEKLEMMGEVPNVENIKNTIREEASEAYKRIKATAESSSVQRFFDRAIEIFIVLVKAFAKIFAVFIMIVVLIALLGVFIKFFTGGYWFQMGNDFRLNTSDINTSLFGAGTYWLVKVCVFFAFAIPLLYILVRILLSMLDVAKPSKFVKQGILTVWFATVLTALGGILYGANQIKDEATKVTTKELIMTGDTLNISVSDFNSDVLTEIDRMVELDVVQNSEGLNFLEISKTARGKNEKSAEEDINNMPEAYRVSGNVLLLHEKVLSRKNPKAKLPMVKYTVNLATGKYVVFNTNTKNVIHHIANKQDIYDPKMAGHVFLMTTSGLSCTDCAESELGHIEGSVQNEEHIKQIDISDAINVQIIEDGTNRIVYPKDKKWRESLDVELKGNTLSIRKNNEFSDVLDWFTNDDDHKIKIYTSGLKGLEVDGSSRVSYEADQNQTKDYFSLEANGANIIHIKNLKAFKASTDIAGTNQVKISGRVNIFLIEADGASSIQALDFESENINVDIAGAAVCNVFARKEITGKVEGAGKLTHKGSPVINVKSKGVGIIRSHQ